MVWLAIRPLKHRACILSSHLTSSSRSPLPSSLFVRNIIVPDNLKDVASACFTGKNPGADLESIAKFYGIEPENIYFPIQKHTDKITVIEEAHEPVIADAVITRQKGILIGVQAADCVPVLLCDPERQVVGAVHAGWRGTAQADPEEDHTGLLWTFFQRPLVTYWWLSAHLSGSAAMKWTARWSEQYRLQQATVHITRPGATNFALIWPLQIKSRQTAQFVVIESTATRKESLYLMQEYGNRLRWKKKKLLRKSNVLMLIVPGKRLRTSKGKLKKLPSETLVPLHS